MIPVDRVVSLDSPSVFNSFSVHAADTDPAVILDALGPRGLPAPENDHVFVTIEGVRSWATDALGELTPEWESGFAALLDAAESNGWLNESGSAIKAHVVSA